MCLRRLHNRVCGIGDRRLPVALSGSSGFSFVSVLIAFFILAVGVVSLLRVYPVINRLSGSAKNAVDISLLADKIFLEIEQRYRDAGGPCVPDFFDGADSEFPRHTYSVYISESDKEGLYMVEIRIAGAREGTVEKSCFYGSFRRE